MAGELVVAQREIANNEKMIAHPPSWNPLPALFSFSLSPVKSIFSFVVDRFLIPLQTRMNELEGVCGLLAGRVQSLSDELQSVRFQGARELRKNDAKLADLQSQVADEKKRGAGLVSKVKSLEEENKELFKKSEEQELKGRQLEVLLESQKVENELKARREQERNLQHEAELAKIQASQGISNSPKPSRGATAAAVQEVVKGTMYASPPAFALAGFAIGGPIGALIGAGVGLAVSAASASVVCCPD